MAAGDSSSARLARSRSPLRRIVDRCSLGEDSRTMLRLTMLTIGLTAGLIWSKQLVFPLADAIAPLVVCLGLSVVAVFYRVVRPVPGFELCMKALIALVAFSAAFCTLTYCLAPIGWPLADPLLDQMDAALGLSAASVVQWTAAWPMFALAMRIVYFSIIPQTILAIVWLGLRNRRAELDTFLIRFMLAALIAAIGFYFLPSRTTCGYYGLAIPAYYERTIEHIDALRSGARTLVTWRDAEGLIEMPSFHAVWAVLLIAAFWRQGWILYPIVLLNLAVIVSTVTTGMHYFVDVFAGIAVAAVVILAVSRPAKETTSRAAPTR
jgi:membrane-associated phospholipid phosphatase